MESLMVPKKVLVPIAWGTETIEAVTTISLLRRAGADVTVASVEDELSVKGVQDITIVADVLISSCSDSAFDLICLSGGGRGTIHFHINNTLLGIVTRHLREGRVCAAIGAAPSVVLGRWGELQSAKATCHPNFRKDLDSKLLQVTIVDSQVVHDKQFITSQGLGTSVEYAVALVKHLFGKEKAAEVTGELLMRPNQDSKFITKEFNALQWTSIVPKKCVLVPIADGSEEMEVVMIVEVLRRAKINVVVASVGDEVEIVACRQVKLVADMLLSDAAKLSYDLIVLPGGLGGAQVFQNSETLVKLVKKHREEDKFYGAIQEQDYMMGGTSEVGHKRHFSSMSSPTDVVGAKKPSFVSSSEDRKGDTFPATCYKPTGPSAAEDRVVVDGTLITSKGLGNSLEFALAIVEKLTGRKKALEIAHTMLVVRKH